MTVVISVPSSLDDQTFEQVLEQLAPLPADAKILVDARYTTWASPYGLTALLTLAQTREVKPLFQGPEKDDTASYWSRANFFKYAEELFEMHGKVPGLRTGDSGALLEITPVSRSDDVHTVVERIQTKAAAIITNNLHLESRAVMGFAMTLSEACQNIVEHAGRGGWVAVQNYNYRKRMGRQIVQIAVAGARRAPAAHRPLGRRHRHRGRPAGRHEPLSRPWPRPGLQGHQGLRDQVGRQGRRAQRHFARGNRARMGR
ncbi:MAG: hypothetical protein ACYC3L_13380 [Gemmatimonadaceae bacterium]